MGQSLAIPRVIPNDWKRLDLIVNKIKMRLGRDSSPTFSNVTITNVVTASSSVFSKTCLVAAGLNVLRVTGLQTDGVAMTGTLRGAYIDVSNGSTAATGTIRGMELKARTEAPGDTGNDVAVLEGLSISADSKGHSVTTMRAAEFILDGSAGGTITEAVGLRIANNLQADKATTSYGLQIYRDSFDYTADIQLSSGGLIGGSTGALQVVGNNVGVGTLTPSYKLSVGSPNGLYQAGFYHDNANTRIKWTGAGYLIFTTDEGTNRNTTVAIQGKGTGYGALRIYDNSENQYFFMFCNDDTGGGIRLAGTSLTFLNFQSPGDISIKYFKNSAEESTQELLIYGYRSGDALRSLEIGVGVDAADTASFDGLSNYKFDGDILSAGLTVIGNSVLGLNSAVFQPTTDSATFFQVNDQDANNVLNIDTINLRVGIRKIAPEYPLDIYANEGSFGLNINSDSAAYRPGIRLESRRPDASGTTFDFFTGYIGYQDEAAVQVGRFGILGQIATGAGTYGSYMYFSASPTGAWNNWGFKIHPNNWCAINFANYVLPPVCPLDVRYSGNFSNAIISIANENTGSLANARYDIRLTDTSNNSVFAACVDAGKEQSWTSTASTRDAYLRLRVLENNVAVERQRIKSNGFVGFTEPDPETLTEWTHATPYLTLHNSTHEDTDGGRESRLNFKGEQSGEEETTLARIEISHDGAADDEKGKIVLSTNDGDDGDTPTDRLTILSNGNIGIGTTAPNAPLEVKGAKPAGNVGGFQSGMLHVTGNGTAEFSNSVITGHSAYNTNTQLWYLGSLTDANNDIGFLNRQNAAIHFYTNNASRVTIGAAGNVTFTGAINSGTLTFSTEGPTDNIDVTGVNTLFVDTSSNSVTIGGLAGGVDGQVLYIARISNVNNVIIEHNEGGATQPILLHAGADETLGTEYGGWVLVCHGGTDWHDCSHAKHVV